VAPVISSVVLLLPQRAEHEPEQRGPSERRHGLLLEGFLEERPDLLRRLLRLLAVFAGLIGDVTRNFLCAACDVFNFSAASAMSCRRSFAVSIAVWPKSCDE
jgi:hypothetical protein